jgi:hypothetical protein
LLNVLTVRRDDNFMRLVEVFEPQNEMRRLGIPVKPEPAAQRRDRTPRITGA